MITSDYVILGAGASGLQLAYRMALDSYFDDKKIVIVDREADKGNDRTWCFWENGTGEWDDIVHKTWDSIYFGSKWFSKEIEITPYSYKMIRSEAYYKKLWHVINTKSNISFIKAEVDEIVQKANDVHIITDKELLIASKLFNSLPLDNSYKQQSKYPVLQQHFVGWFIHTDDAVFDANVATFMDFDIPQNDNTRFMYILPTSKKEALFEYTLFSKDLLKITEYEDAIELYLSKMGIKNYTIVETEKGSIPMTSYKFHRHNTENILHMGSAGGWTKASTGYTFMNTSKKTKRLIEYLKHSEDLSRFHKTSKFWFYDLLMLDVLAKNNAFGAKLFSSLFKNSKLKTIFRFLDEESNLAEDIKIMSSVPPLPFIKAVFRRLI